MSEYVQMIIAEDKQGKCVIFMAPLGTVRVDRVITDVEGEMYIVKAVETMALDGNEYCFFRQMMHCFDIDGIYDVDSVVEFRKVEKAICESTEE